MKKTLLAIAISATTFSSITMAAPGDPVPNVFSNGTPADATLVNENFDALSTQIGDLAASGVAGPAGGTAEKPVGTVWIGYSDAKKSVAKKFHFTKDRMINIQYSVLAALNMIRINLDKD